MPRLPLFPLNVVLFPGTPMPLHIFEPRYCTMLADCLEGDERFGIIYSATSEPPPAGSVGCTAHIHASQLLDDGRSNIVVVGESRFIVERYLDEALPYSVATVAEIDDTDANAVSDDQMKDLARLGEAYLQALHDLNDSIGSVVDFTDDPEVLSFQLSAALELEPGHKQDLLATRLTGERVRQLLRLFPPLVRDLADRARVHVRARGNGKSHHPFTPGS
ncbi:MAG: LON peptidase substrate-binding domain-containing protein [Gemmatimonadota bacterium]